MIKIAFYIMNQKGYSVLVEFVRQFNVSAVSHVVSFEDKRIKKDFYSEITDFCQLNNIDFYNKSNLEFEKMDEDYKVAIGWKWIIKDQLNLIVFHDSLLPRYRGFSPLVSMLINNEQRIGVTALRASLEYDKGDILAQESIEITYPIKIQKAIDLVSTLYISVVSEIYERLLENNLNIEKQNELLATYSLWRDDDDYKINWNDRAENIRRFIDAVGYPYKGACTFIDNEVIRIHDVEVINDVEIINREDHLGKIIFIQDGYPVVICKCGLLKIENIFDKDDNQLKLK